MSFTIAHLSDAHLGPAPFPGLGEMRLKRFMGYVNWKRGRERLNDMAMLARLVADLRAQSPDHVAMTGDAVNIALRAEFRRAAAWMRTLGRAGRRQFHAGQSRRLCARRDGGSGRDFRAVDVERRGRRGARSVSLSARARRGRADRPQLRRADRAADGDRAGSARADRRTRRSASARPARADWRASS